MASCFLALSDVIDVTSVVHLYTCKVSIHESHEYGLVNYLLYKSWALCNKKTEKFDSTSAQERKISIKYQDPSTIMKLQHFFMPILALILALGSTHGLPVSAPVEEDGPLENTAVDSYMHDLERRAVCKLDNVHLSLNIIVNLTNVA